MAYIDREDLLAALVGIEKRCTMRGDRRGAKAALECRKATLEQKVVYGEWQEDICNQCGRETKGAMEQQYDWCPKCGAEMTNWWGEPE